MTMNEGDEDLDGDVNEGVMRGTITSSLQRIFMVVMTINDG